MFFKENKFKKTYESWRLADRAVVSPFCNYSKVHVSIFWVNTLHKRHWVITSQMQSITITITSTSSITITNKQNHNVIDYDFIESNHDYNCDYICLETSSERKQKPIWMVWYKYILRQHTIWINAINEIINLWGSSTGKKKKYFINCWLRCSYSQQTSGVTRGFELKGKFSWKTPTVLWDPVNTSEKKNLRNDGESGCGWLYYNPKLTENILQNDKNLLKIKRILKPKYKLSEGLVFTFSWPGGQFTYLPCHQLLHCNKHWID